MVARTSPVNPSSALAIAARKGSSPTFGAAQVHRLRSSAGMIGALPDMAPDDGPDRNQAPNLAPDLTLNSAHDPAPVSSDNGSAAFRSTSSCGGQSSFADLAARHESSKTSAQRDQLSSHEPPQQPGSARGLSSTADKASSAISPSTATSPFAALAAESSSRRNLNALKVLSRLVAAIARRPGSNAPQALKAQHLVQLISQVQHNAQRLALSVAPLDAHRGWVRASAMEAAASIVASQWESDPHGESTPLEVQIEALEAVFDLTRDDPSLSEILNDLSENSFAQATEDSVAVTRVELSSRLAAWDLYSHVSSPLLGQGGYRFTYGRKPAEVVALLLPQALTIARESPARFVTLDVVTSHMQACIRRCADLLGAEYVSRTRALMNWIAQDGISDQEFNKRFKAGCDGLEGSILPAIVESARSNFLAIESMAVRGLEETVKHDDDEHPRGR